MHSQKSPAMQAAIAVMENFYPSAAEIKKDIRLDDLYSLRRLVNEAVSLANIASNEARAAQLAAMKVAAEIKVRIEIIEETTGIAEARRIEKEEAQDSDEHEEAFV
jgi:hypothetical protein